MSHNPSTVVDPSSTPTWKRLAELSAQMTHQPLRELLAHDRSDLVFTACGLTVDYSRQRIDDAVLDSLIALAQEVDVAQFIADMNAGIHVNNTEDRAVLHTALRAAPTSSLIVDGFDVITGVHAVLDAMATFAAGIRSGSIVGSTGHRFTDVVNIGIGGSDLGPAMTTSALSDYADDNLSFHYVSNLDPADLRTTLLKLDPATTLFIVVSKTFTTAETMANAQEARRWLVTGLDDDAVTSHFVAVSTNLEEVARFGISSDRVFGFWDWVGGRFSLTSAVGLSTMIAIGPEHFDELLSGFRDMDQLTSTASFRSNPAVLMGLIAVWNRDFLDIPSTAVLPYSQRLSRFPAYLQQLTMESNGKSVRRDGTPVTYPTGAIYWGEPGTNGQHSFYQLLHQGTSVVSADIIVVLRQDGVAHDQQRALVAHALAQASVLTMGRTQEEWRRDGTSENLLAHKEMLGNRPTTVISMERLTPYSLGALIAVYENSVVVQGAIWGINSFDQWGVELGKKVAHSIESALESTTPPHFDTATNASIELFRGMGV